MIVFCLFSLYYAFGNKSDLKQRIPYEEIEEIAREQEPKYFEII